MDRLSPLDALFVEAEDQDPHTSMAIASIAVFEGPAPSHEDFLAAVAGRLPLLPRYRQKLRTVPFRLGRPVWVEDPRFDLGYHVRRTALPAPGGDEQLRQLMGRVMSQRLDRDHPLWEYWVAEGLTGGRWAVISKIHHCMVDGVSGTDLYRVIFDFTPQPPPPETDDRVAGAEPTGASLAAQAAVDLALIPVRGAAALSGLVTDPVRAASQVSDTVRAATRLAPALWPAAGSSLTGPIGRQRRYTWSRTSLSQIKAIKRELGGTVNDVVLAAISSGFRDLLLARGEEPGPHTLPSLVPVSLRAPGEENIYENRVSALVASLPVHVADPVDRLAAVRSELAGLKDTPAVTRDGHVVRLTANIGLAEEVPYALAQGCEGIGLVRTELFYLAQSEPPDEDEQCQFYTGIVKAMAPRPVTFRTLDLGGDKTTMRPMVAEANPMLGCRGIRLLSERRELFVTQMRALLRASCHGPIEIMFPLITSLTEFQDTLRVVDQVKRQLRARRQLFDERVRFGCMIETPAAATIPDLLATEVEFFSIGSNDLIQYTLAADRTNPRVAHIYEPLHLAVLRMMRSIIRAAHRQHRPVCLCGEMAADPIYTIILLGLGVDELSMNPVMIPAIKQVIRGVSWAEARELARGVLRERRAKDVQTYLERMMANRFPQVMSIYGHREEASA